MKRIIALVAALFTAIYSGAQPMPPVAPAEQNPTITLPPEPVTGEAKYDLAAVKVRAVPYHVSLTKAPEAWAKNPAARGKGLKVAIVDTWGQADHPGFHGMVKGTYSAITKKENPPRPAKPNPHCCHCAGIVHSIVPDAELYLIEGMDSRGTGTTADLAHGVDYAVNTFKVDVVSCSFGGPGTDPHLPAAIKRACDAGVVVICAAGNDGGGPGRDTEGYPARYDGATSVAACGPAGNDGKPKLATFSSWGPTVFTTKPGVNVTSLLPDNMEGEMSGTSMACPVEAGCAASWIASNAVPKDKDRWKKYREAVKKASPFQERNNGSGYGLYTLDKITADPTVVPPPPPPPPGGDKTYVVDVAKLKAEGYTSLKIDLGAINWYPPGPGGQTTIPVTSLSSPSSYGTVEIGRGPGVILGPTPTVIPVTLTPHQYVQPQTVWPYQVCPPQGCRPVIFR